MAVERHRARRVCGYALRYWQQVSPQMPKAYEHPETSPRRVVRRHASLDSGNASPRPQRGQRRGPHGRGPGRGPGRRSSPSVTAGDRPVANRRRPPRVRLTGPGNPGAGLRGTLHPPGTRRPGATSRAGAPCRPMAVDRRPRWPREVGLGHPRASAASTRSTTVPPDCGLRRPGRQRGAGRAALPTSAGRSTSHRCSPAWRAAPAVLVHQLVELGQRSRPPGHREAPAVAVDDGDVVVEPLRDGHGCGINAVPAGAREAEPALAVAA